MDDINRKLEDILNDPASMEKVRQMADALLTEEGAKGENREEDDTFGGADIGRIMKVISRIENRENDNRAKLLLALKPHLTERRREKVDYAVKLLKLIEALPLLKEAGILNFG